MNPLLEKSSELSGLNTKKLSLMETEKDLKNQINQIHSKMKDIYDTCTHKDKNGISTVEQRQDNGHGHTIRECTLCYKDL